MDRSRTPAGRDEGFTLIEVVVALGLLVMVMVALLGFFVRSSGTVTAMQRRQAAVGLADQAMEVVRTVLPTAAQADQSLLVKGRTALAVSNQWSTAPSFVTSGYLTGTSGMAQVFDSTATGSSTPVVPFSQVQTVSNEDYTITQYIGTCNRTKTASSTCDTTNTALTSVQALRVVIVVTWTPPAGQKCNTTPCSFALSSLVDFADDPLFMINGGSAYGAAPVANPDAAKTNDGTAFTINVKSNDTGTFGQNAVAVLTQPLNALLVQGGTIALYSGFKDGTLLYTPVGGKVGVYTFTYKVSDTASPVRTSTGTGTITVEGRPTAPATLTACVVRNSSATSTILTVLSGDPSTWSDHTFTLGATTFPGTVVTDSSYGAVKITSTSSTLTTYTAPMTVTDQWGATDTVSVSIQVKSSCP